MIRLVIPSLTDNSWQARVAYLGLGYPITMLTTRSQTAPTQNYFGVVGCAGDVVAYQSYYGYGDALLVDQIMESSTSHATTSNKEKANKSAQRRSPK